jgi:hypothetical protein
MINLTVLSPKVLDNFKKVSGVLFRNRVGRVAMGIIASVAMVAPATAQIYRLNGDEMNLYKRIASNSGQQRDAVNLDPSLCLVARKRAADMAARHYFSHTNPDGQGANYLVRRAGYTLPSYYDRSRGMSTGTPREMVSLWLHSSGHRVHVLGELDFYKQQTSVGVGVFRSPEAPHYKYYVFLSAPPNGSLSPRALTLKSPTGATLASTRPLANALAPFTGMASP